MDKILVAVAWADIYALAALRFLAWVIPAVMVSIIIIWYRRQ